MSKDKVAELIMDGAEVAFKQTLESSLLKDIPIISSIVKIHEIGASIRDQLYTAKISKFLLCLNEISDTEKERMLELISHDSKEIEKLSEKIILILESQSDIEKSDIIANLFLAYIDNEIESSDFRRALDITSSIFLDDLKEFLKRDGFHGFMLQTYEDVDYDGLSGLINTPFIAIDNTPPEELKQDGRGELVGVTLYKSADFGFTYLKAYHYGRRLRHKDG